MPGNTGFYMKNSIFSAADILLPPFAADDARWGSWSVIACDQFTSEKEYWDKAWDKVGGGISALELILPEAYLGTADEDRQKSRIADAMAKLGERTSVYRDAMVYVERTLPGIGIRRGIVGKLDLERYDYAKGSASAIRPTEATVLERIPPRMKIRGESDFELPHVMVFTDAGDSIVSVCASGKDEMTKLYDFDLMLGGGHITGYLIDGGVLADVENAIEKYEAGFDGDAPVVYAVGDGNHSLAAAKAHYEAHKGEDGYALSRYALCEIVDISDPAIEFEPIYRIVKNCDPSDLLAELQKICGEGEQRITAIVGGCETELSFAEPSHALVVGTLQNFIDAYIKDHPGAVCDYIHGIASLRSLSDGENVVGFLFDGMAKDELFPYVEANGVLPRKTFSMGDSYSKRYYTEARRIKE